MTDDSIPEWDISPLVKSVESDAIREEIDSYVIEGEEFEGTYRQNAQSLGPDALREAFEELERFMREVYRIRNYCWMKKIDSIKKPDTRGLVEYAEKRYSRIESVYASFRSETVKLLSRNPGILDSEELKPYRYYLSRMRERSAHFLTDEEERLMREMHLHGKDAWTELHSEIIRSSTRRLTLNEQEKEYSVVDLLLLIRNSPVREDRKQASQGLHNLLASHKIPLCHAYRAISRSYVSEMRKRQWQDMLAPALHRESIGIESLQALEKTIKGSLHIMRRYFKVKAALLHIDRLGSWDLFAPVDSTQAGYSWSDARAMVVNAYSQFDSGIGAWVDGLFNEERIDAKTRPEKISSGSAYSFHKPNTSWITLHFTGNLRDIITLAHEMGHGVHSYLSAQTNSVLNWRPGLCMSETASVFGELLLLDFLISQTENGEKISVLCRMLDKLINLVYFSQVRFEFEKRTYDIISQDRYLDVEDIGMLWKECRDEVFGDEIEWTDDSEWRWAASRHPFMSNRRLYNFPYAFGQLLTYALYEEYRREDQAFVPKLKMILRSGGAGSPKELLGEVGFDITSERFWERGIRHAEHVVEQLETLLKEERK